MAKTATRAAAKPVSKAPPPKPTAAPSKSATASKPAPRASVPATAKNQEVADPRNMNLPAHMQGDAGMGTEKISQSDLEIPRLKLIQGVSPELQVFQDLRAGNFFHTASETIFDEPFRVVPLYYDKKILLWNPREAGGGILARSDDAIHWSPGEGEFNVKLDKKDGGHQVTWKLAKTVQQSGLANWGTMNPKDANSPPAATLMHNFVFAFPDFPDVMPAVFSFQRSSIKVGRKFLTKLRTVRTPIFGSVFTMSAVQDTGGGNDFLNVSLVGAGLVEDPEQYEMFKALHQSIAGTGLNIKDIDGLQDEGGTNETDEDPAERKY